MPWKASDAQGHSKKANTPALQAQWAKVANGALTACKTDGGTDCEAKAIMAANAAVGKDEAKNVTRDVTKKSVVVKYDNFEGLLYGVALEPETVDSQGDIISSEEIQKAAHNWMTKSQLYDEQHADVVRQEGAVVIESFIAPHELVYEYDGKAMVVKEGSWVVVTKLVSEHLKKEAREGRIGYYSIRGFGKREAL